MFIENIVLALIFIALGIYEHYRMVRYWIVSDKLLMKQNDINNRLHKRKLTLKHTSAGLKDYPQRYNFIFLQSKTEELLWVFGGRHCKSDFYDTPD
jgi:hypothetical protein